MKKKKKVTKNVVHQKTCKLLIKIKVMTLLKNSKFKRKKVEKESEHKKTIIIQTALKLKGKENNQILTKVLKLNNDNTKRL